MKKKLTKMKKKLNNLKKKAANLKKKAASKKEAPAEFFNAASSEITNPVQADQEIIVVKKIDESERIPIKISRAQTLLLKRDEFLYAEAYGKGSKIYRILKDGVIEIPLSKTLKQLEPVLNNYDMLRVHHKYIVNLNHLMVYNSATRKLLLECDKKVSVSKLLNGWMPYVIQDIVWL